MFARPTLSRAHTSEADARTLAHTSPEDSFDAGESTVYDHITSTVEPRLGKAPAHAHIPSVDSATMRMRRIATLAYNSANEMKEQTRQTVLPSRWLVLVSPPPILLEHSPLGSMGAMGPAGRESSGCLMPLYNTLFLQLSAIAREFNFPSAAGLCCYMNFSDNGSIFAPRITDDAWIILWRRYLFPDDIVAAAPAVDLPIAGRLEFDIDFQKARWYEGWVRSGRNSSLYLVPNGDHASHDHWEESNHSVPEQHVHPPISNPSRDAGPRPLSLLDKRGVSSLSIKPVTRRSSNAGTSKNIAALELDKLHERIQADDSTTEEPLPAPEVEPSLPHEVKDRIQKWRDESAPTTPVFDLRGRQPYMESEVTVAPESPKIHIPYLEDDIPDHTEIFEQELDLDDFTWSISSAGPPLDFPPLPSLDTPIPSVHILNRMEGSVLLTASIATSWGPPSEWPETPATESVVPTPDIASRQVDNALLTPSTAASSWGPPLSYRASPIPVEHVQTPDLAGRMADDVPRTPSSTTLGLSPSRSHFAFPVDAFDTLSHTSAVVPERPRLPASASAAAPEQTHVVSTSFAWPYVPSGRHEPVTASSRYGVFNLYPPVYPHFDIYPAMIYSEPTLPHSHSSKPSLHSFGWPYMPKTTLALLPMPPSRFPHSDRRLVHSSPLIHGGHNYSGHRHHGHQHDGHNHHGQEASKTAAPTVERPGVWKRSVDAFSHGWPYTQTMPKISPILETCYPVLVIYPNQYPYVVVYPEWTRSSGATHPPVHPLIKHEGYPYLEIYPSVLSVERKEISAIRKLTPRSAARSGQRVGYPKRTDSSQLMSSLPSSKIAAPAGERPGTWKQTVDAFSHGWPYTQAVPSIPSAQTFPKICSLLETRYPVLVIYPTQYPHLVVYPEWMRSSGTTHPPAHPVVKREGYPHFELYPSVLVEEHKQVSAIRKLRPKSAARGGQSVGYPKRTRSSQSTSSLPVSKIAAPTGERPGAWKQTVDAFSHGWPYTQTVPSRPSSQTFPKMSSLLETRYPVLVIYPTQYPHLVVYPEWTRSSGTTHPPMHPVVKHEGYPHLEIYPSVLLEAHKEASAIRKLTPRLSRLAARSGQIVGHPTMTMHPAIYPHFDIYPKVSIGRSIETSKNQSQQVTSEIDASSLAYQIFDTYPAVYPIFDIYPPIVRSPTESPSGVTPSVQSILVDVKSYPIVEPYPPVYPDLQIYPTVARSKDGSSAQPARTLPQPARTLSLSAGHHRHIVVHPAVHTAEDIPCQTVALGEQYPSLVVYPPVYPHFDIYPEISRSPLPRFVNDSGYPYLVVYPPVYPHLEIYASLGPVVSRDGSHTRAGRSKQLSAHHHHRSASPHRHVHWHKHEDEIPPVPPLPVNLLTKPAVPESVFLVDSSISGHDEAEIPSEIDMSLSSDSSAVHSRRKQKRTHAELHLSVFPSDTVAVQQDARDAITPALPGDMAVEGRRKSKRTHAELHDAVFSDRLTAYEADHDTIIPDGHPVDGHAPLTTSSSQRPRSGSIWTLRDAAQQASAPSSEPASKPRRPTSLSLQKDILVLPASGTRVSMLSFGAQGISHSSEAEGRARPQKLDRSKYPFF